MYTYIYIYEKKFLSLSLSLLTSEVKVLRGWKPQAPPPHLAALRQPVGELVNQPPSPEKAEEKIINRSYKPNHGAV